MRNDCSVCFFENRSSRQNKGKLFVSFLHLLNVSVRPSLSSAFTLGTPLVQQTMSENAPDSLKESIYSALHKWYAHSSTGLK